MVNKMMIVEQFLIHSIAMVLLPFMSSAGWNGTMSDNVAAALNLEDRMALLNQDYQYCTKTGLTNPNTSDTCRIFLNTLDDHLNVMLTGKTRIR